MTDIMINQIVRCFTGEYSFCLDARLMEDLHLQNNYLPEPGKDGTVGQLLLGDNRIPVFSMGQRLGLSGGEASEDAVILQLRAGEGAPNAESWGLLVDKAEGPLPASPGDFREIPSMAGDPKHGPFPWLVRWEVSCPLLLEYVFEIRESCWYFLWRWSLVVVSWLLEGCA